MCVTGLVPVFIPKASGCLLPYQINTFHIECYVTPAFKGQDHLLRSSLVHTIHTSHNVHHTFNLTGCAMLSFAYLYANPTKLMHN